MVPAVLRRRSPLFVQNAWGFLFAVPALAFLVVFNLYPLLSAFYISFTSWQLAGTPEFVGLENYVTVFTRDEEFYRSVGVTAYYALGTNPPLWAMGLALALLFNRQFALRSVLRTVYFVPVIVSWVVAAIVWSTIFHPTLGLNAAFFRLLDRPGVIWLADPSLVMPAMMVISVWKALGYQMVLFLAGLQGIPADYQEAAAVDGANARQRLWYITLPLLKPTILFVMVVSIIGSFQVFTPVFIMTGGGPAGASRVLPMLIYEHAFKFLKMGYATALAMVLFAILMSLTLLQMKLFKGGDVG
jgi:ABC-type sugar transport system permease subunit